MCKAMSQYLGLCEVPEDFLLRFDGEHFSVESLLSEVRPALLIIDPLRAFRPGVEGKPRESAGFLNEMRRVARKYGVAIVLLHHLRQEDRKDGRPCLENSAAMDWLTEASGARALLNHVDLRLRVDDRVGQRRSPPPGCVRQRGTGRANRLGAQGTRAVERGIRPT
jgi:hypothetical protein